MTDPFDRIGNYYVIRYIHAAINTFQLEINPVADYDGDDENCAGADFSPPLRGGVAARSIRCRVASSARADGVVIIHKNSVGIESPPGPLHKRRLRNIIIEVAATPPRRGGEKAILVCCHTGLEMAAGVQPLTGRGSKT